MVYVLALECADRISIEVANVALFSFHFDVGMLAHQQPSAVSKEDATFGIVRVGFCLRELVMHAVITTPFNDVIL